MHTSMDDRLRRSRAPKGERAYDGKVCPQENRGKNTTLIAPGMGLWGMGESMAVKKGATDSSEVFEVYVEHFSWGSDAPRGAGLVVLDGLGAHRPKRIRELIEARGAELVFLPSYYWPDLNPIEEAFSKIKNTLGKVGARTHEALVVEEAMGGALREVTPWEAAGWFDHCGYEVEVQYL